MNTLLALLTVLFSITDPPSDAIGDGSLTPPTGALYASSAVFDIHELTLQSTDDGELVVVLTMAELDKDADYINGFRSLVADVYIDIAPDGENALYTPGEWLLEPGEGWEYLVRLTPDGTYGFEPGVTSDGAELLATEVDGSTLFVYLPTALRVAEDYEPYAYALTGLYDPFSADSWRAVASVASPWSFSSDAEVPNPVLDLTAPDFEQQEAAMQNRVLPKQHVTISHSLWWVVVMLAGLVIAVVGWVLRFQKRPAPAPEPEQADVAAEEEPQPDAEAAPAEELSPDAETDDESSTDTDTEHEPSAEPEVDSEDEQEPETEPEAVASSEDESSESAEDMPEPDEPSEKEPEADPEEALDHDADSEPEPDTTKSARERADPDDDEIIIPFVEREPRA